MHNSSYLTQFSETSLSHDLVEYIQYCDAISDLIKRYEIVQFNQEKNEAKRAELEKEKYEIESGGGKAFSLKGTFLLLWHSFVRKNIRKKTLFCDELAFLF